MLVLIWVKGMMVTTAYVSTSGHNSKDKDRRLTVSSRGEGSRMCVGGWQWVMRWHKPLIPAT